MEMLLFTGVAIVLYVVCDRVVLRIEAHLGRRLEHRSLLFFVLLLGSALLSFPLIRSLLQAGSGT